MRLRRLFAAAAAALALAAGAHAQQDLKFQAMPLGSIWYVFAASFTKHIQPALPAGAKVDVVARGGGIGNVILVNEKKADLGFANVCTSAWAMQGEQEIYKGKKHPDIRAPARRPERGVDRRHADRGLHQAHRQRHAGEGAAADPAARA